MTALLKRWAFIVGTAWALLAFVAWHYESECGFFFNSACLKSYWDGVRWMILLKWVLPYQTLLGGFAALAAGTFVLLAAKQTAADMREANRTSQKRAAIVACSIVSGEFRDAWYLLDKRLGQQIVFTVARETPFTQFST